MMENNIEELTVLLESIHITNINKYLEYNKYLLDKDLFLLAQVISDSFNKNKDYYKTKVILTKNKYDIINAKE